MSLLISFVSVLFFCPALTSSQFTVSPNEFAQSGPVSSQFIDTAFAQPSTLSSPISFPEDFSSANGPISSLSYFTNNKGQYCYNSPVNGTVIPICSDQGSFPSMLNPGLSFSLLTATVIGIFFLVSLRFVFYYLRIRNQPLNQPIVINMQPSNVGRNKKKKITLTQEELESYSIIKLEDFISQTAKVSSSLPLPPNSLEKEQPHSYIEIGEDVECMICFEQINMDDDVRVIPCYHVFHSQCLDTWLTTQSCVCPTCRLNLKTVNDEDNTNTNEQQTPPPNTTTYQMPRPNS
ncbi:hypothetical protein BB559_006638 [Furculomyces boomerangus]|uniref:RING-type domain-containing protein n=2 Tax=Harpellales TaxID=61421 RepID=A0A2T9Y1D9_9FUNG|nr:hypothetical protein BB559_006638 [Furculomyces boomerangus]PWA01345.1 hypothetical protein BB558_002567 [Smittium angustum]